jgi:hypothetical protein
MDNTNDIKKIFLKTLIVSLSATGLLGIFIFLFGKFGETEGRLLLTTLSMGGCSLTGLCCSTIYPSEKYKIFSIIGIGTAGLCFVLTLFNIWGDFKNLENTWKLLLSLIVLTITFAHISLLLNIKIVNQLVKNTLTATTIFIGIVAFMLLTLIVGGFGKGDFFYRLLGVFGILDIVGTIVTPILNKTQKEYETK